MQRTKPSKSTVSARAKIGRVSAERAVAVREWIERRVLPYAHSAVGALTRELESLKAAEASPGGLSVRAATRIRCLAIRLLDIPDEVLGADAYYSRDFDEWWARRKKRRADAEIASAGPSRSASVVDPIEAAMSIVKAKANHGVDWSREPLSERERKIRARLIGRIIENDPGAAHNLGCIATGASLLYLPETWPSDLRTAYEEARKVMAEELECSRREELDEAAREVDEDDAD